MATGDNKFKYAIVRIPENSIVDFFSLILAKGFSDVSFVSNLTQCNLRDDPNDEPTSSSVKDMNDDDSTSENNKSSPPRRASASASASIKNDTIFDNWPTPIATSSGMPTSPADLLSATMPTDLLNNLFGSPDLDLQGDWAKDVKIALNGNCGDKFHPYPNGKPELQTRMKGWQREYIKDVIMNGHYPTEEELRDIEQKCDLSRKQVLRFIAKRLVNPNRKPRINHIEEKRKESEERSNDGQTEEKPIIVNKGLVGLENNS